MTATTPTTPVLGFLRLCRDGIWELRVPCPSCGHWHTHGAGVDGEPIYQPGDITERVPHCADRWAYGWVVIAAEPFRPAWMTPRGKQSAAWKRHVANARQVETRFHQLVGEHRTPEQARRMADTEAGGRRV